MLTELNEMERKKCKFYKIEEVTSCYKHIFNHSEYKLYCYYNNQKEEILPWYCEKCPHYQENKVELFEE